MKEPKVHVGILFEPQIEFILLNPYRINGMEISGKQVVTYNEGRILWNGRLYDELLFEPVNEATDAFELLDVTIGINFHWERKEDQRFLGSLKIIVENKKLTGINVIHVEDYLTSVISSEMSATASLELLKAHAVISRSWLLAIDNSLRHDSAAPNNAANCQLSTVNCQLKNVAPTEKQPDGSVLCGQVHDPLARVMNGGISGNAGVFSCAEDIAVLCAALQNGGEWNGHRILSPLGVKAMHTVPRATATLGRTLGWDNFTAYASNNGDYFSPNTYGHTGYTGTSIIIDPDNDTSVILLVNAVHPEDGHSMVRLRSLVANVVAASIYPTPRIYTDHYYKRFLQFMDEPAITSKDIVMVGNSLTEGGGDWNARLNKKNIRNRGIIGDEVMGIYDRLHQILPGHPKKLFLLAGVNDISHDLTVDSIVSMIRMTVERIQRESPDTRLYLQSLLPFDESFGRYKKLTGKTDMVPEINAQLEVLAKDHKITFINLFPLFTEKGTNVLRKELTSDGLHLNEEGYKIWVKALKKRM